MAKELDLASVVKAAQKERALQFAQAESNNSKKPLVTDKPVVSETPANLTPSNSRPPSIHHGQHGSGSSSRAGPHSRGASGSTSMNQPATWSSYFFSGAQQQPVASPGPSTPSAAGSKRRTAHQGSSSVFTTEEWAETPGEVHELKGPFSLGQEDYASKRKRGASPLKPLGRRSRASSPDDLKGKGKEVFEMQPVSEVGSPPNGRVSHSHDHDGHEDEEERDAFPSGDEGRPPGAAGGTSTPGGALKAGTWSMSRRSSRQSTGEGDTPKRPAAPRKATSLNPSVGWNALRAKIKPGSGADNKIKQLSKTLSGQEMVTELTMGMLPMMMVKMATVDRDENGGKRIPVLMQYLKLRITDSVHPLHDRHASFRIELEYGDGQLRWTIYRELKDFINLHAHYRFDQLRAGNEKLPTFPRTSLPYLNWLKSEGRSDIGKAEFAKMQREALETYLLKLIRATMFGPGANRLCTFLEISAFSVTMAAQSGQQGKQGYMRILSSGASRRKPAGFHPLISKFRHSPKWFVVRESYIIALDSPATMDIYDVFLFDSFFELERPTRLYRQGLQAITDLVPDRDGDKGDRQDSAMTGGSMGMMGGIGDPNDPSTTDMGQTDPDRLKSSSAHTFYIKNSQQRLRLVAKSERQMDQFVASIEKMVAKSIWAGKNRFDSFAPIRLNASAQWLVDGRDYFWSLSRAIMLAKERIYIHDWWLSPELYLRRPALENKKWRLDKLLQRKAREGVQIFVIVYKEVSNDFTPVDSNYTKTTLRNLHPNIKVQRSPSHTSTGTLLWSHHEKMCVIDETIGFMGGFDLCFGRWDTPGHVLVDDGPNPLGNSQEGSYSQDAPEQIWPGKDYSNQRVLDFHTLNKPDEDMYDRMKVPRQPWHDIGLQIIGQPARDLCRHFVQRWNYLLRTKNHTTFMPFLTAAADFTPQQLMNMRINGTCETQICRSVGSWSMGVSETEHSIQNAYIKSIQMSDHFVYIENQFFISSTEVEGTAIENKIGDALVSRIIRAHHEDTPWRAIIVLPLLPGYPFPLDHPDAGSVRMIVECQNRTICRGDSSIFARLRREGIDPDEYITFFGLRGWGKLGSGVLTSESIYIHAKAMIVDDRLAIIGSANINERSQRGDRDSELACVIRDTDMIDSTMAGQPYKVGRFAHTMRVRLMREHLGIDVDEVEAEEAGLDSTAQAAHDQDMSEGADSKAAENKAVDDGGQERQHGGTLTSWATEAIESTTSSVVTGLGQAFGVIPSKDAKEKDSKVDTEASEPSTDKTTQGSSLENDASRKVRPEAELENIDEKAEPVTSHINRAVDSGGAAERNGSASVAANAADDANASVMSRVGQAFGVIPTKNAKDKSSAVDTEANSGAGASSNGAAPPPKKESTPPYDKKKHRPNGASDDAVTDATAANDDIDVDHPGVEDPGLVARGDAAGFASTVVPTIEEKVMAEGHPKEPAQDDGRKEGSTEEKKAELEERPEPKPAASQDPASKAESKADTEGAKATQQSGEAFDTRKLSLPGGKKQVDAVGVDTDAEGRGRIQDSAPPPDVADGKKGDNEKRPFPTTRSNEAAAQQNPVAASVRRNLREKANAYTIPIPAAHIDPFGLNDPLIDKFYKDVWMSTAARNTQIFRKVFRCMPDDLVTTWKQYREFQAWSERHNKPPKNVVPPGQEEPYEPQHPQGAGGGGSGGGAFGQPGNQEGKSNGNLSPNFSGSDLDPSMARRARALSSVNREKAAEEKKKAAAAAAGGADSDGFSAAEHEQMEECLAELQGTLVIYPTRFLEAESIGQNFLFAKDRLPPIAIYD